MEDKKYLYLIIGVIVIIFIGLGLGLFFYVQKPASLPSEPKPIETNTNDFGYLPTLPETETLDDGLTNAERLELEKEKQFISSFWQSPQVQYTAQVPAYDLPLIEIKEQVVNYRDFSRKIDVESALPKLTANGFVVVDNPFDTKIADWERGYKTVRGEGLPIFITADSVVGVYQNTLHVIYKEIEQEIFYPSLWELLKKMHGQAKKRYETKHQQLGIESDAVTEANRLELVYLTVALKLLKPDPSQVKESLATETKFFTPLEADTYKISIPGYLEDEVNQEIKLIDSKSKGAKSPIFLYQKSYAKYNIPKHYQTSEKLKNYYLTITWLNDNLFPLWNKENDCPDCFFDQQDHTINFLAGLYLSDDLASNQNLKNRWANIYKSISFFKGLEVNLTYLDYHRALQDIFGQDYNLDEIFGPDSENIKTNISKLQEKIISYSFPQILSGQSETKEKIGLRLLRNNHLLENELFNSLTGDSVGTYLKPEGRPSSPFTACPSQKTPSRCLVTSLDLFNLLNNKTAQETIDELGDNRYEQYQQNLNTFIAQLEEFDQYTWHDNAYLSLLSALGYLERNDYTGWPTFMQNEAWAKKSLNTSLAAWTNFHRDINFEKASSSQDSSLNPHFPYGYIEPQIEFYHQLAADTRMIMDGFINLQIIANTDNSFKRLEGLKELLDQAIEISRKELTNETLNTDDYNFINNFDKQVRGIIGDIKKGNIQNSYTFNYNLTEKNQLNEKISGFNYLIAIYPDLDNKLFFAIGPVFNYNEQGKINNSIRKNIDWQNEFKE